jgi:hypothetical protein
MMPKTITCVYISKASSFRALAPPTYKSVGPTRCHCIPRTLHTMAPIALGSPINRYTQLKKVHQEVLDGFGTRAIHVGSDPDPNTGAVIPAISLSTTYKQDGVGIHKVSRSSGAGVSSFLTPFPCCDRASSIPGLVIPTEPHLRVLSRLSSRVVHTVWLLPLDLLQPRRSFSPWVPTPTSSA